MDKEYWDSYYKRYGLDEGIQEARIFIRSMLSKGFQLLYLKNNISQYFYAR